MKPILRTSGTFIAAICISTFAADAATWDAGGGASVEWSTFSNWEDDASPAGKAVVFSTAGLVPSASDVSNRVTEDVTIQSLLYQYNDATNRHVTEIDAGVTLSITGAANALTVGGLASTSGEGLRTTHAVIKGGGHLSINQEGGKVLVSNVRTSNTVSNPSSLDLQGLANFSAALGATGSFEVGTNLNGTDNNQRSHATLYLADTNTITAGGLLVAAVTADTQISIASSDPTALTTTLYLGRENIISTETVDIGVGYTSSANGAIKFNSAITDGTLRLRGITGAEDDAVELVRIGVNRRAGTSNSQFGLLDLSGGEVDALIDTLQVAGGSVVSSGRAEGSVIMDRGKMVVGDTWLAVGSGTTDVNRTIGNISVAGGEFQTGTLVLAETRSSNELNIHNVEGVLTVSGAGDVSVGSGIVMGNHTSENNTAQLWATLNILGGSLSVQGAIAEGNGGEEISSVINLSGGTLDLNGHGVSVDQFNVQGGTLRSLGEFNGGAALVKTTAGTLVVEGVNTYTGLTDIQAGELVLNGSVAGGVRMAAGSVLSGEDGIIGGALTMETGSSFSFTLESSTDFGNLSAGAVTLEAGVNLDLALFYAPLEGDVFTLLSGPVSGTIASVNGVALVDNLFTLDFGIESYEFALSYGGGNTITVSVVPEPSSFALGGSILLAGAALLRRRPRKA